jgi:hypothetical protein
MDTSNLALAFLAALAIGFAALVWGMVAFWWRAAQYRGPLLLERMMRRNGLELSRAPDSANLELALAARRCTLCASHERCRRWLVSGKRTGHESFCPNAQLIERLKERWPQAGPAAHAA